MPDDGVIGIVDAVFLKGAAFEALDHFLEVGLEVDDADDVDGVLKQAGLLDAARHAVENEQFGVRVELVDHFHAADVLAPDVEGKLVGHEFAAAGVSPDKPAGLGLEVEAAEDVAGGRVEEAGD